MATSSLVAESEIYHDLGEVSKACMKSASGLLELIKIIPNRDQEVSSHELENLRLKLNYWFNDFGPCYLQGNMYGMYWMLFDNVRALIETANASDLRVRTTKCFDNGHCFDSEMNITAHGELNSILSCFRAFHIQGIKRFIERCTDTPWSRQSLSDSSVSEFLDECYAAIDHISEVEVRTLIGEAHIEYRRAVDYLIQWRGVFSADSPLARGAGVAPERPEAELSAIESDDGTASPDNRIRLSTAELCSCIARDRNTIRSKLQRHNISVDQVGGSVGFLWCAEEVLTATRIEWPNSVEKLEKLIANKKTQENLQ